MKLLPKSVKRSKGFTLPELLVAMSITIVLVLLTLIITGQAIDAWKAARTEIRAAGQAKVMLNALGRDLESMVSRMGTNNEQWLVATTTAGQIGPAGEESPNASQLTFFTAAADRYNGNAGSRQKLDGDGSNRDADLGGDVSAVSYQLDFVDPVFGSPNQQFATFVLYRNLLDPIETYNGVSGEPGLEQAFRTQAGANELVDLMCENVFEFSMTFVVSYRNVDGNTITTRIPVMAANSGGDVVRSFEINGGGLAPNGNLQSEFKGGRITSVELSITVLSDEGVAILKRSPFRSIQESALFIEKNGFRYSRSVAIPQG